MILVVAFVVQVFVIPLGTLTWLLSLLISQHSHTVTKFIEMWIYNVKNLLITPINITSTTYFYEVLNSTSKLYTSNPYLNTTLHHFRVNNNNNNISQHDLYIQLDADLVYFVRTYSLIAVIGIAIETARLLVQKFTLINRPKPVVFVATQLNLSVLNYDPNVDDIEPLNENETCSVCRINKKQCAYVPCGHKIMCVQCTHRLQQTRTTNTVNLSCIYCNQESLGVIKIYDT